MARLERGESTSQIARSLGVCIQSVQHWARSYRLHGKEGLRRSPKSGPRPKLAHDKLIQLSDLLAKGPLAYGFETPVWTSERIASLIWSRFRARYSFGYVKRLLATLEWRWHEHTWLPPRSKNFRSKTSWRTCGFSNGSIGICHFSLRTILDYSIVKVMAHTTKNKEKLLTRVRRIRGQVDAIERALDSEQECTGVLQLMAACRGALNGLMAEVMEGHVRFHVLSPENRKNSPQAQAAEELIDVVRAYLK